VYRIDLLTTLHNSARLTAIRQTAGTIRYRYLSRARSPVRMYIYMHEALNDGNANNGNRMFDPTLLG